MCQVRRISLCPARHSLEATPSLLALSPIPGPGSDNDARVILRPRCPSLGHHPAEGAGARCALPTVVCPLQANPLVLPQSNGRIIALDPHHHQCSVQQSASLSKAEPRNTRASSLPAPPHPPGRVPRHGGGSGVDPHRAPYSGGAGGGANPGDEKGMPPWLQSPMAAGLCMHARPSSPPPTYAPGAHVHTQGARTPLSSTHGCSR